MECEVPSYVADFTRVVGWVDSEGNEFNSINGNLNRFKATNTSMA